MTQQNKTEIVITALNQTQQAFRELKGQFSGLTGDVNRMKGAIGSVGGILSGLGIVAGFAVLAGVVKEGVAGFIEQEHVAKQLEERLRSTGGAVGYTSQQLQDYATELQRVTAFDDDAVVSTEALLATFTQIRGPIFKDAIAAILDISVALNQDLKSSAVQVGKALNDPVGGLLALRRAGVMFTESQKEQIKVLVQTGKAEEAQKIILQELQTEFGGSARAARDTLGGALISLQNNFGNVLEELVGGSVQGGGLVKAINDFSDAIANIDVSEFVRGIDTVIAQFVRLKMFYDQAMGTQSSLNMMGAGVGSGLGISEKKHPVLAFLLGSTEEFERAAEINLKAKEYYDKSDKFLQAMANREVGLDENGNPLEGPRAAKGGKAPDRNTAGTGKEAEAAAKKAVAEAKRRLDELKRELAEATKSGGLYEWAEMNEANQAIANFQPKLQAPETGKPQKFSLGVDTAIKSLEQQEEEKRKLDDIAAKKREITEAEATYQLSLIDTAEAYHQISKAEAADRRLALTKELLTVQEQWLGTMDKAADPSAYLAQAAAVEELRQGVLGLKKTVQANSNDMAGGFDEGLARYKETIPSLFESSRDAGQGFLNEMEGGFEDLFGNVLRGKVEGFADFFQQIGDSMLSMISQIMADMTMASLTNSAGGWGELFSSVFGAATANAKGNVFSSPSLSQYSGQVVSKPTYFKFAYGAGVMGEGSDPEGIFPLARDKSGKLGVRAMLGGGNASQLPPTVNIKVENQLGQDAGAEAKDMQLDLSTMSFTLLLKKLNASPGARQSLKTAMG